MKIIPQIKYKSVLTEFTDIKERNYAFNNLDAQSQRLEIAWDALQLVVNEVLQPSYGTYWNDYLRDIANLSSITTPYNLQQSLLKLENKNTEFCQVCQRGLIMVSTIRLGNEIDPRNTWFSEITEGSIDTIKGFTIEDFKNMEKEYEFSHNNHPYEDNTREKLANICCNILVNGNFNIKDKKNYLKIIK